MNAPIVPRGSPATGHSVGPARAVAAGHASLWARWGVMARVGLRMMFHDKLKMVGTLAGVVFAVVLSGQQAGTFLGLLYKNVMFVQNAEADLWIAPKSTQALQPGQLMSDSILMQARTTPGVRWAEPLLWGGANLQLRTGGSEQVTLIGVRGPSLRGGPWNMVVGEPGVLLQPETMIFEDSERQKFGALNLGSTREVNGHRVVVGGFTWGLLPFGPAFAFAELDLARSLMKTGADQLNYVLVGLRPGADSARVAAELRARAPEARVFTKKELERSTIFYILTQTAIGVTFGTATLFGLIVGFVIVALSMFSAVVDNMREFATLKAMGSTNWDLAKLLVVQSIAYALLGSLIGLALVTQVAGAIRSPKLAVLLPSEMLIGMVVIMVLMCTFASSLALLRLRKVEPAMVFK